MTMGMWVIEFIMEVEERYGVEIPESELESWVTIDDAVNYVAAQTGRGVGSSWLCSNYRSFDRLRRAFREVLGVPIDRPTMKARLDTVVPREGRRRHLRALTRASGLPVRLSIPGVSPQASFMLAGMGALGLLLAGLLGTAGQIPVAIVVFGCTLTGVTFLARRLQQHAIQTGRDPAGTTVADLIRDSAPHVAPTREGLRAEICEMAQCEFTYMKTPITGETRFADLE
ncbi:MAG TPA: acyl carrier protein [Armatimonadota bacterium]|nr:acyl carrier protein [Armatimonadota bacterium]